MIDDLELMKKAGIRLWADKPIDITTMKCPHCKQEVTAYKNIESFLNYLYTRYSTRYVSEKGVIHWEPFYRLKDMEKLLEEKTGVFVSEFTPLPLFLTHQFDYKAHPEYINNERGLYLVAVIETLYDLPEALSRVDEMSDYFETLDWYSRYLYDHYDNFYQLFYEFVDQHGQVLIPLQEIENMT